MAVTELTRPAAPPGIAAATAARRDHFVAGMSVLPFSFNWFVVGIKVLGSGSSTVAPDDDPMGKCATSK